MDEAIGVGCEPPAAVEHVLEHVVGGVAGVGLGVDDQPRFPLGSEHVAGVQVGAQQDVPRRRGGQRAEGGNAVPGEVGFGDGTGDGFGAGAGVALEGADRGVAGAGQQGRQVGAVLGGVGEG